MHEIGWVLCAFVLKKRVKFTTLLVTIMNRNPKISIGKSAIIIGHKMHLQHQLQKTTPPPKKAKRLIHTFITNADVRACSHLASFVTRKS